jgi:integrase
MARNRALKNDPCGARLYGPTDRFDRYRVTWPDPVTGKTCAVTHHDIESADAAYDQAVAYLMAAGSPAGAKRDGRRRTVMTVDDLFAEVVKRWKEEENSPAYIEGREGVYRNWVQPVCGDVPVSVWGASNQHCRAVLAAAREAGRKETTVQNIGALMRKMVTEAHDSAVLAETKNPMRRLRYASKSGLKNGGAKYVPPKERPSGEMVDGLSDEFDKQGARDGRWWLYLLVRIAAFGGLRTGELLALRPEDVIFDGEDLSVMVERTWSFTKKKGYFLKAPKNDLSRHVLLPGSIAEDLMRRVEEVTREQGADGLLFPGPKGPTEVFTHAELRRLFERCARNAGWECAPDRRSKKGKLVRGCPVVPWRNLRHHAATWMFETASFEWVDVSRALGHASVAFTLNRYVRSGVDAEKRNALHLRGL